MIRRNALGITRALGCLWLVVAALSGLLAIWNLPVLVVWPLGLAAMGLLTLTTAKIPARLIIVGGAAATLFAIWVAAGSNGGNENFALVIGALSAALAIGSASARALLEPTDPPISRDIGAR